MAADQVEDSAVGDAEAAERAAGGQHLTVVQQLQAGARGRLHAGKGLGVLSQAPCAGARAVKANTPLACCC